MLLDQLAGGIARPSPLVAEADHLIEIRVAVAADDLQLLAVDPLDAGTLVGHDLAQLRQDQAGHLGHAQRAAERMCRGAERLGLLARGALGLEQARVLDRDRRLGRERRGELRELLVVESGSNLSTLMTPTTRSPTTIGAQIQPRMRPAP